MQEPPQQFSKSNNRNNDPWDHDAVSWMLDQLGGATEWNYHNLFECARRQPKRLTSDLDRVVDAAHVCGQLGVEQLVNVFDQRRGKMVVRLRRTDPEAPVYPAHYEGNSGAPSSRMETTSEDRQAAARLLGLLPMYQAELVASGKSPNTIHTYVDRAERFLRRVAG